MKYIKQTLLAIAAATTLAACDLDQYPYSETASDDYVKDTKSLNSLVIGAYNSLHSTLYYEWAMTELRSDNARMYATGSTSNTSKLVEQLDQSVINSEHEWVDSYWQGAYVTIDRSNRILENLNVVNDAKLKAQYEGEARFLRSLEYFNLVRLFGPVFIVTKKTSADEARVQQRSDVEQVYALIESDLETIVDNSLLPEQMASADLGRATLNAAKALLAKVYATHYDSSSEKYRKAITLCREVMQSSAVGNPKSAADLVAYDRIFDISNEMNREIIFAVRYTGKNQGLGSPFGNLFAPINNGANVIVGTSSSYNTPSDDLITAYEERGDEVRSKVNYAMGYYNKTTQQWVETETSRYCCKYTNEVTTQYDGESDFPIIRVADVALLLAEMINETDGPTAEALKYLNMIVERAKTPKYEEAQLSNPYTFREAVRLERRLELAFENQRWFDLMRWDEAMQTVNSFLISESFYSGYAYQVKTIAKWQTLLPIPITVININEKVAQNYGY